MAFLFVVVGIYFSAYNLSYQYSLFGYALVSAAFAMLITTPMLSMKVLAEERRQKVDQLLLTSPVPLYQIVLGKYLAMIDAGETKQRVVCDYIAGMTDQYAITKFGEYFLPRAWQVDGY